MMLIEKRSNVNAVVNANGAICEPMSLCCIFICQDESLHCCMVLLNLFNKHFTISTMGRNMREMRRKERKMTSTYYISTKNCASSLQEGRRSQSFLIPCMNVIMKHLNIFLKGPQKENRGKTCIEFLSQHFGRSPSFFPTGTEGTKNHKGMVRVQSHRHIFSFRFIENAKQPFLLIKIILDVHLNTAFLPLQRGIFLNYGKSDMEAPSTSRSLVLHIVGQVVIKSNQHNGVTVSCGVWVAKEERV